MTLGMTAREGIRASTVWMSGSDQMDMVQETGTETVPRVQTQSLSEKESDSARATTGIVSARRYKIRHKNGHFYRLPVPFTGEGPSQTI